MVHPASSGDEWEAANAWAASRAMPTPAPAPSQPEPEPEAPAVGNGCDPNYTGCVPISSSDLDCPDVGFSMTVIGVDIHGFDREGDGLDCESF